MALHELQLLSQQQQLQFPLSMWTARSKEHHHCSVYVWWQDCHWRWFQKTPRAFEYAIHQNERLFWRVRGKWIYLPDRYCNSFFPACSLDEAAEKKSYLNFFNWNPHSYRNTSTHYQRVNPIPTTDNPAKSALLTPYGYNIFPKQDATTEVVSSSNNHSARGSHPLSKGCLSGNNNWRNLS